MSRSQEEHDLGGNNPSPGHTPEDDAIAELQTTTAEGQQNHNSLDEGFDNTIANKPTADNENEEDLSTADWAIEGVKGFEGDDLRHMNAFFVLLKDWYRQKNYTASLLTREGYNKQVEFELYLKNQNRVLEVFYKPTMVANSQVMRTIMLGAW